jgi:hypothetical protein
MVSPELRPEVRKLPGQAPGNGPTAPVSPQNGLVTI